MSQSIQAKYITRTLEEPQLGYVNVCDTYIHINKRGQVLELILAREGC